MNMLKGKTIIVTGTARGLGRQMVETFAREGANVIACARKETEEHRGRCEELAARYGVSIFPVYFDMTDEAAMKEAIKEIRHFGLPIDGLVNNAGITSNALFQMTGSAQLRREMEVNFFAPYQFTQFVSKLMLRNRKGSIVSISSSAALDGYSGKSAYGASKAALLTMTLCISEELAAAGIRANVICPGVTETDMLNPVPEEVLEIQRNSTFLKKNGKPGDIANAAAFLLSDLSSYITGQVLRVDGGITCYRKR